MEWLLYPVVVPKAFQGMGSRPTFSRPRPDQWSLRPRPRPRPHPRDVCFIGPSVQNSTHSKVCAHGQYIKESTSSSSNKFHPYPTWFQVMMTSQSMTISDKLYLLHFHDELRLHSFPSFIASLLFQQLQHCNNTFCL